MTGACVRIVAGFGVPLQGEVRAFGVTETEGVALRCIQIFGIFGLRLKGAKCGGTTQTELERKGSGSGGTERTEDSVAQRGRRSNMSSGPICVGPTTVAGSISGNNWRGGSQSAPSACPIS